MNNNEQRTQKNDAPVKVIRLVPGVFSKCSYCDEDNNLCRKYDLPRYGTINYIGEYTWENYCMKNGGCDR